MFNLFYRKYWQKASPDGKRQAPMARGRPRAHARACAHAHAPFDVHLFFVGFYVYYLVILWMLWIFILMFDQQQQDSLIKQFRKFSLEKTHAEDLKNFDIENYKWDGSLDDLKSLMPYLLNLRVIIKENEYVDHRTSHPYPYHTVDTQCEMRADITSKFLERNGVIHLKIGAQLARKGEEVDGKFEHRIIHQNTLFHDGYLRWKSHVAVAVLLQIQPDGPYIVVIIDTTFFEQPVTLERWLNRIKMLPTQRLYLSKIFQILNLPHGKSYRAYLETNRFFTFMPPGFFRFDEAELENSKDGSYRVDFSEYLERMAGAIAYDPIGKLLGLIRDYVNYGGSEEAILLTATRLSSSQKNIFKKLGSKPIEQLRIKNINISDKLSEILK